MILWLNNKASKGYESHGYDKKTNRTAGNDCFHVVKNLGIMRWYSHYGISTL